MWGIGAAGDVCGGRVAEDEGSDDPPRLSHHHSETALLRRLPRLHLAWGLLHLSGQYITCQFLDSQLSCIKPASPALNFYSPSTLFRVIIKFIGQ